MTRTHQQAEARISELERLVSSLRHGINGALSPTLMIADRLRMNGDPKIQRAGEDIVKSVIRITDMLKATRDLVPPGAGLPPSPLHAADSQPGSKAE